MVRPAAAALLVWFACLWSSRAEAATVMIVYSPSASAEMTEAVSRLHGELLSVGLAATLVDREGAGEQDDGAERAWLKSVAVTRDVDAALEVIGEERLEAVDIWVFQPAPLPPKVVRVPVEGGVESAPARLAIRAVDLVRSMLIERDLDRAVPDRPGARPRPTPRIGFELGGAILTSLDGVGPAILPVARVEALPGHHLGLQAELAGLGTRPTVGSAGNGARIAQQYGLFGVCLCAPSPSRFRLVMGLAAGALRTAAEGQADAPLEAHAVVQWSLLFEATAGLRVRLGEHGHLTIAGHVQVAQPYVDIRLVNVVAATSGRPNLVLTAAIGEWL
jgi:hypothetical protein